VDGVGWMGVDFVDLCVSVGRSFSLLGQMLALPCCVDIFDIDDE